MDRENENKGLGFEQRLSSQSSKQSQQALQFGHPNQEKQLRLQRKEGASKKQLKKQERKEKWDLVKRQKRKQQRQKEKEKRKQKRELQPKKQQEENINEGDSKPQHRKRKQQYKQKMLDAQKVVIDLQFFDLMTEKQKSSLGKQLAYCHSVNRKMERCFNFIITSATQQRTNFLDSKYNITNFGINIIQDHVIDSFNKQNLVYLTGDAQQELTDFQPNDIYIIGGIVDHNRLKQITINYAKQNQIRAKRLPMQGLKLKASVHLAVNHVWEWMLRFYNGSTWKDSLKSVIPQRKLQEEQIQNEFNKEEYQRINNEI